MSQETPNFKVIAQRQVYECPIFKVDEESIALSGVEHLRYTVRHPGAAVFLPLTDEGKLLLVEQYRSPVRKVLLEAPAGTLEPGEDPLCCAQREIQEEVGMKARNWTFLGELYPAPGFCDEHQFLYVATDLSPSVLPADEDEDISVRECTLGEVEECIVNGKVVDAKTLSLLFLAKLRGIL